MAHDVPQVALIVPPEVVAQQERALEVTPPDLVSKELTPEEARAVEAVFAQQQENHLVAGILGMWTGALVLHDLAVEHFSTPEEDERIKLKKKKKDPEAEEEV